MRFRIVETRLGLRNSRLRIPFRYGKACMTVCPQVILAATIEGPRGRMTGWAGDCLPPGWFDKSPLKSYRQQIDEMLRAIACAEQQFTAAAAGDPVLLFPTFLDVYQRVQETARDNHWTPLLASFGISIVERALMDAIARSAQLSFHQAVLQDLYGLQPARIHPVLGDASPNQWLAREPARRIFVRHTVGLGDPLTAADVHQPLEDGFPETLEQTIQRSGVRYFKVKVSNQIERDLQRLRTIAALLDQYRGPDYQLTLDGNEQYPTAAEFFELIEQIKSDAALRRLWRNTLLIEQPLERSVALDADAAQNIGRLSQEKAVIIDESDGTLDAFAQALELGYRGVSSKNCKGPFKSILNAGLVWWNNGRGQRREFMITGEDLCTVGIIPMQSDLCLVAALGLEHVERNGHHYHPGIRYLTDQERQAALREHSDLYAGPPASVAPRLVDGQFQIGSLQCAGMGFAVPPDFSAMQSPQQWTYESLGVEEPS